MTATGLGSALLLSYWREGWLVWSFAYLAVRNLFAVVWLLARPCGSKEPEIWCCAMNSRCCVGKLASQS